MVRIRAAPEFLRADGRALAAGRLVRTGLVVDGGAVNDSGDGCRVHPEGLGTDQATIGGAHGDQDSWDREEVARDGVWVIEQGLRRQEWRGSRAVHEKVLAASIA